MARGIIVIELDVDPASPDVFAAALSAIDPPSVPGFAGNVRVAVDGMNGEAVATKVCAWLEES